MLVFHSKHSFPAVQTLGVESAAARALWTLTNCESRNFSSSKICQEDLLFYTFVYSSNKLNDLFCIKYETRLYSEVSSGVVGTWFWNIFLSHYYCLLLFVVLINSISHLTFILEMLRVCFFRLTNLNKEKQLKWGIYFLKSCYSLAPSAMRLTKVLLWKSVIKKKKKSGIVTGPKMKWRVACCI